MDFLGLLVDPFGGALVDWPGHVAWALVPLRIALGYIVFDAGKGKWERGISGTGEWLRGLGFPAPQLTARFVASVEVVAGPLLMLGLLTPVAALLVAANMTVAAWTQKFRIGAPFRGGDVQGYELDVLMAIAALTLFLGAPTPFSIDSWLLAW